MKLRQLVIAVALALAGSANALDVPKAAVYDARVRTVIYNPSDVVQIDTMIGIATTLTFEDGEKHVTHAFGDAKAFDFAASGNHVFIRPTGDNAEQNLTIVTDRRTYYFWLSYKPTRKGPAMYGVTFQYPEVLARRAAAEARKEATAKQLSERRDSMNREYLMSGDLDIAPVEAWDNGEFTYFRIAGNKDAPGFFMVDADGQESIVNRDSVGAGNDVVVLHKVAPKWIVRLGNRALAVWNDAYKPDGVSNRTGTASPSVTRVVKGTE